MPLEALAEIASGLPEPETVFSGASTLKKCEALSQNISSLVSLLVGRLQQIQFNASILLLGSTLAFGADGIFLLSTGPNPEVLA